MVVTDLGKLSPDAVHQIDQPLSRYELPNNTVNTNDWRETRIHKNTHFFDSRKYG
jgi:hypothetical protein